MRYVFLCYDYQGMLAGVFTSKTKLLKMYSKPRNKNRACFSKLEIYAANTSRKLQTYSFLSLGYFFKHVIFTL